MKLKKYFATLILFSLFSISLWAQTNNSTTPESYTQEEFPQVMLDIRRFEIITLGAMPFVTLDAAIVYNGYKYFSGKTNELNLLATTDYNPQEMKRIIITSLCVSAGIGITDYVVRLVKRNYSKKKNIEQDKNIWITENPDAVKIPLPEEYADEYAEGE